MPNSFGHSLSSQSQVHGQIESVDSLEEASMVAPIVGAPPWLLNLRPNIQSHDPQVINYFLNKFVSSIATTFPTFQDFEDEPSKLPELILAAAAIGGVLCSIPDSFKIALSLHNDARRLALNRVSITTAQRRPIICNKRTQLTQRA